VYFSTYGLVWSNIRNSLDAEKAEKGLKYTEFTELKKITSRIDSNCSNYCSLFFKSFKFRCSSFYFIQKNLQLTVQVCCLFYFLLHNAFSKEKLRVGFWWVYWFKWAFQNGWFFLFGSNYVNAEDNYERLIDFLSQISKLSNFNALDLADFMMHHWLPVSFFVLIQSHTCACNMCFVSSFVINRQFRWIDHNGSQKPISVLFT